MEPYLGEIKLMPLAYEPEGWIYCDGRTLPVAQYQALFSLLGTYYGGDGRTNFQIPDLRGRVPVHMGYLRVGAQGGSESIALSPAQLPAHNHQLGAHAAGGDKLNGLGNHISGAESRDTPPGPLPLYAAPSPACVALASGTVSTEGSGAAHENMQPYLALNYFIAIMGVYPMRP